MAAMGLVVACWFVSFLPFFVTSLYRAPVIALLFFPAAAGTVETARLIGSGRSRSATVAVGALMILWALLSRPVIPVDPGLTERHVLRGSQWRFKGNLELAEREFRAALATAPASQAAASGLAAVLLDTGRVDEAGSLLETVAEPRSGDASIHFNLGLVRSRQGDWSAAAASFRTAAELSPNLVEAHLQLGISSERIGNPGAAVTAYERVLELDPSRTEAANNLAWLLATAPGDGHRDGRRAVELARRAVRSRRNASTLDTLAAAYAEAGDFDQAVATVDEAIRANRTTPMVAADDLRRRRELFLDQRPYHRHDPAGS
jgi:Flp pilus assembly protein TadD